jgi:hypothetical protein
MLELSGWISALAVKTIGGGKAPKIGDRLEVPNQNVCHVGASFTYRQYKESLYSAGGHL